MHTHIYAYIYICAYIYREITGMKHAYVYQCYMYNIAVW